MATPEVNKQVSELVFNVLSERNRHRSRTDLKNLYRSIKKMEPDIDEEQFMAVFKGLAAAGAGSLIIGRRGNPNRFIWKYNLKAIADAAITSGVKPSTFEKLADKPVKVISPPAAPIVPVKMKAEVKPQVTTRKPRKKPLEAKQGTFLQIDLSTMRPEDVAALIALVSPMAKK